jgi:hypothetical protein
MADWTNTEVDLIIADYFSMLDKELSGQSYNKTEHRRALIEHLNLRSNASIEFKHANISAVLIKLGLPFIKGYMPRYNYQNILEERVIKYLRNQKGTLEPKFIQFAEFIPSHPVNYDFSKIIDEAPEPQLVAEPTIKYAKRPIKINYLEREQTNISLGEQGESLVIEYEKWNLINNGKNSLADKIEWVSKFDDGAGFDILSKNLNGTDKFIEVKTTKLSKDTPIFFSKNEYEFSKEKSAHYTLYRVFNFTKNPKIFLVNGNFDSFCKKEAVQFKGYF